MSSLKVFSAGSSEPAPPAKGTLRLYGNRFCPYVFRVRLVLAAKNVPHEVVNIDLKSKPEWYLVKNPEGKVPAIEFDDNVIYESLIISDYLDNVHPEPKLWANDPLEVAKGKILVERIAKMAGFNGRIYLKKDLSAFKDALGEFNHFNAVLQKTSKQFFSGDQVGMVDYMIWPFFETVLCLAELESVGDVPQFLSIEERPALSLWIEKMQNDEAVQKATTGKQILKKYYQNALDGQFDFDTGLTD